MNRNMIIGFLVGILVLGGAALMFMGGSDDNNDSASSDDANGNSQVAQEGDKELPTVFPENAISYPLTMRGEVTDSAEPNNNGSMVIAFASANEWSLMITAQGETSTILYINDFSYLQDPTTNSWFRIPIDQTTTANPVEDFGLDETAFDDYRDNATYEGKQSCSIGTCDTWSWTDPDNSSNSATLKVGSNGRIADLSAVSGTSTSEFTYDYDSPVSVEAPADYQDFSDLIP